jgi:hypothetical protein
MTNDRKDAQGDQSTRRIQSEELEAMRAIFGDDWNDISPAKTAWGIAGQEGWWEVKLRAKDGKVGVTLKGRMGKVSQRSIKFISCNFTL